MTIDAPIQPETADASATSPKPSRKKPAVPYAIDNTTAQISVAGRIIALLQHTSTLQTALAKYGYTAERMQQGAALLDAMILAQRQQQHINADVNAASAEFNAAKDAARAVYSPDIALARLACANDPTVLRLLGLTEARRSVFGEWLVQAREFYTVLLSETAMVQRVEVFGLHRAQIVAHQQLVEQLPPFQTKYTQATNAARTATKDRNTALAALRAWLRELWHIARFALKDQPELQQLLELAGRR